MKSGLMVSGLIICFFIISNFNNFKITFEKFPPDHGTYQQTLALVRSFSSTVPLPLYLNQVLQMTDEESSVLKIIHQVV